MDNEEDEDQWTVGTFTFGEVQVQLKYIHGNDSWSYPHMCRHVWPGALLLCKDMAARRHLYAEHSSVLILGAGTGLEGLVNAALFDGGADGSGRRLVCLTDGASMSCDLMQENIALNAKAMPCTRFHVGRLRFGESRDVDRNLPHRSPWDCVAISDSTFDFNLVPSVLETLTWLEPRTLIVCSVTGGAPAFERLTEALPKLGLALVDPPTLPSDPTSRAARNVVLRYQRVSGSDDTNDDASRGVAKEDPRAAGNMVAGKVAVVTAQFGRTAWTWTKGRDAGVIGAATTKSEQDDEVDGDGTRAAKLRGAQLAEHGGTTVHGIGPHTADGLLQRVHLAATPKDAAGKPALE